MQPIKLPTANIPKPDYLYFKPPTARIPSYKPMVIPPSDLEAPEEVQPEKTTEQPASPSLTIPVLDIKMPVPETAVVVTAVSTALVAVATTSITSSLFEPIKKKVQKFLQKKIDKWKEDRKKKKVSSANLKMQQKTKNTKSKS